MNEIFDEIYNFGVVPVVVLNDAKDAVPLAKALCDGGLPCAEVTFRTDAAEESIKKMSAEFPEMLIGAGTVLTTEQVDRAVNAGAKFIVSPGLNPKIVKYCVDKKIPIIPGVTSPSQIEQGIELGLEVVKFFPAEASGGLNMIKAMAAAYTKMKFMPTGGVNEKNIVSYLNFDKIVACGGSWMVPVDLVEKGDFTTITKKTKEAVATVLGFEIRHVGVNCENEKEAETSAGIFETLFGFEQDRREGSIFCGTAIELMKTPYYGKNGHIAFATNSVDRAIAHLVKQGAKVNEDAITRDAKGNIIVAYFQDEISGFAYHVAKK